MQYLGAFSKMTEWSWLISKDSLMNEFQEFIHWFKWINDLDSFSITVIQLYAPTTNAEGAEVERFYDDLQELLKPTPKRCPFHHSDWNAKVGSQEKSGVTGTFCLGVQNEVGQRLTDFCQENTLVIAKTLFQ